MLDFQLKISEVVPEAKMKNNSVVYLAFKYLRGRKPRGISRAHYLSLAGISLGVMALICVSSVMNGFRYDIRNRIVGTNAEIRLSNQDSSPIGNYAQLTTDIEAKGFHASPVIRNELLLKRNTVVTPSLSFGINLTQQQKVTGTLQKPEMRTDNQMQGIVAGNLDEQAFEDGGIVLGAGLATKLGAYLGDNIQVLSPMFSVPTAFGMIPKVRFLKVLAIFTAGMPEYDQNYSYMPFEQAAFFASGNDAADYIEIKTPSFNRSQHYLQQLRELFPKYQFEDWSSFDSSLYGAIRFEKFIMFVIMLFMFIIASFNLTGNLLKLISQKKRELGLLKALGLSDRNLRSLFMIQSLILCSLGIVLGLGIGSLLLAIQAKFGVIRLGMGDSGAITLPVKMMLPDYLLIMFVSYFITVLSVLVPLKRIAQINAVELIRRTA